MAIKFVKDFPVLGLKMCPVKLGSIGHKHVLQKKLSTGNTSVFYKEMFTSACDFRCEGDGPILFSK